MKKKFLLWLVILAVGLVSITGCSPQTAEAVSEGEAPTASTPLEESEAAAAQGGGASTTVEIQTVSGWLGYVVSPAADADDAIVLMPEGTGEFGLVGATAELEEQIVSLRNAEEPGKYVHFWGILEENAEDHGGMQLVVTHIRQGATATGAEAFESWEGTLTTGTFNGGQSVVFSLSGRYPMQFSAHSNDPSILEQLQNLAATGSVVRLSGELLTGVPDVNGSRLQVSQIDVISEGQAAQNTVESFDPKADWKFYANKLFKYTLRYPETASLSTSGVVGFPTDEMPEGLTADEYMAKLQKQYGNDLCVKIEYALGEIMIAAPMEAGGKYAMCGGGGGIGVGEMVDISEPITIDGVEYTAQGFEFIGQEDTLATHYERLHVELENGMLIMFGSTTRNDATFEDYQMKGHDMVRQIVETLEMVE